MKKGIYAVFTILLVTLFSCSEVTGEFKYMDQLKKIISETYETGEVEINIKNRNELTVSLLDPKFDDYSPAEKERISREIGRMAQEMREGQEKIKTGVVNFRNEKNYGVEKTSDTETFQMYE